jgi:hypothetical protein
VGNELRLVNAAMQSALGSVTTSFGAELQRRALPSQAGCLAEADHRCKVTQSKWRYFFVVVGAFLVAGSIYTWYMVSIPDGYDRHIQTRYNLDRIENAIQQANYQQVERENIGDLESLIRVIENDPSADVHLYAIDGWGSPFHYSLVRNSDNIQISIKCINKSRVLYKLDAKLYSNRTEITKSW